MRFESIGDVVLLAVVVFGCAAFAAIVRRRVGLGSGTEELWVTLRATVQLLVVGLLITAALSSWLWTSAFVALMIGVAARTSGKRLNARGVRELVFITATIALAAIPLTFLLMAVGLLPAQPVSIVPTAGIFIGNAMTGITLAGRRCFEALTQRRGEVEAALSIGLLSHEAKLMVCRPAARLALVPTLDTTRTVGLVTLPGAFVGTLLGGATPLEASALQLVVLVGIIVAQTVAVPLVMYAIAHGALRQRA